MLQGLSTTRRDLLFSLEQLIFKEETTKDVQQENFSPALPLDLRAEGTAVFFGTDQHIFFYRPDREIQEELI